MDMLRAGWDRVAELDLGKDDGTRAISGKGVKERSWLHWEYNQLLNVKMLSALGPMNA